jgi:hypothetical protein
MTRRLNTPLPWWFRLIAIQGRWPIEMTYYRLELARIAVVYHAKVTTVRTFGALDALLSSFGLGLPPAAFTAVLRWLGYRSPE